MSSIENVTDTAVWGSLVGSTVLFAFITVQAITDPARRSRFGFFALVTAVSASVDFLHGYLSPAHYELLRVSVWSFYGAAVVWLHGHSTRAFAASAAVPLLLGYVMWSRNPGLAMTVALPLTLVVATITHALQFRIAAGYSSAVLASHSAAMAFTCCLYPLCIGTGDIRVITIGYAHWAFLNVLAVVFGWIHLPRELRGLAPVRMERHHARALFAAVMLSEVAINAGLLFAFSWPPVVYLVGNVALAAVTAVAYFHHRHRLVIYTDNIAGLLEERTADLQAAQSELARQNEVQAEKLAAQEMELSSKAEVIERQRRLELAAQTAGQAAHDIQNILSPLLGALSEMSRLVESGGPGAQATALIRKRVEDLLELNGQLLALSRRGRLERNPVRLADLADELKIRFPGAQLTVSRSADAWISGSWAQLSRAALNLISNGLEAAGPGGHVMLTSGIVDVDQARPCHLGYLSAGRHAMLQVTDDGPGIEGQHLDHIFEPFFSLKRAGERSGSGLGLSIVAAVVDDHRGVVDLQSRPGRTVFTLYFPVIEAPGVEAAEDLLCGNATVLVTEDDTSMLDWYARLVEEAGYTVLRASSGQEAIHHLQAGPVDAMLLDLKMPQMTGYETFFGAMHLCPGIRAVVHSSYVADEDANRLRALGIQEMLQKPASRRDILLALKRVLADRSDRAAA